MRQRLAHGVGHQEQVQLALEQHRHDVGGRLRLRGARFQDFSQTVAVMLVLLRDALVQARERAAMRGQDQGVVGQAVVAVQRTQVQGQRVGIGFVVEHAHVGGNARQHHVARDQHVQAGRMQRRVFRGMAIAHDHAPRAGTAGTRFGK
ncbi:hypothetical protein G6F64_014603 [Rhizopus arrhizus]|uniref:Uncharacterized protein n=1 Tax=Rhizopus oryzae TaxID=64495 RepID=A0A9P6WTR4_RHIOR|nr:hypothetical protein G6F64_014603 [Rhizopus arrhizus]